MVVLAVVDDFVARELLKKQIKSIRAVGRLIECNSAEEALFAIMDEKPDLVVASDVLPTKSSFDLVQVLKKNNIHIPFIILSNNPDRAVEAIQHQVYGFLVYPFTIDKLAELVRNIKTTEVSGAESETGIANVRTRFKINSPNGFSLFDMEKLTHCIADRSYTTLFFDDGTQEVTTVNLGRLDKFLNEHRFLRINRSIIVNLSKMKSVSWKCSTCIVDTASGLCEFKMSKACLEKLRIDNESDR